MLYEENGCFIDIFSKFYPPFLVPINILQKLTSNSQYTKSDHFRKKNQRAKDIFWAQNMFQVS